MNKEVAKNVNILCMDITKKRIGVLSFFLVVFIAALYGQFLWNPIVFDDLPFFMLDEEGHSNVLQYSASFSLLQLRSLPYATLAWTAQLFGFDLIGFRIGNLLLHVVTVLALFFFLSRLFEVVLAKAENLRKDALSLCWMAFFAALLFGLHPVATYGVGYLVQRTGVMATLFSLLALLAYMQGLIEEKRRWLAASVILYFFAVFSKEHAIMLPIVMLALTLLLREPSAELVRKLWPVFAACAAIALLAVLQRKGIYGNAYEIDALEMLDKIDIKNAYPLSIQTQCFMFFKYWILWLLPNPAWMSVDMRVAFAQSLISPYWLALAAYVGYGVLASRLLLKRGMEGLVGFAMLFPWLLFATEFASIRIQEPFVLYRSYLWMPGTFAALPAALAFLSAKRAFLMLLFISLLFIPLSIDRLSSFSHPLLLWDDAEVLVHDKQDLPGASRIYYNRGRAFYDAKKYADAVSDFKRAVALRPKFSHGYYGLGVSYFAQGDYSNALAALDSTILLDPDYIRAYYARGLIYRDLKQLESARGNLRKSCKLGWQSGCAKLKEMGG